MAFDCFNHVVPFAIESNVPKDVNKLIVYLTVSGIPDASLIVENTNKINTICKIPTPPCYQDASNSCYTPTPPPTPKSSFCHTQ